MTDHLAPTPGAPTPPNTADNGDAIPPAGGGTGENPAENEDHGATEADISAATAIIPEGTENDWTLLVALYALNIAKKCRAKRKIHDESSVYYQRRFNVVTIFLIALGALITAISQLPLSGTYFKYIIGILGLISTALAAIFKFLKYEALQSEHRLASQAFLDLREEIQEQFVIIPKKRQNGYTYLSRISKQFRNIVKQAPNPPKEVLEMLKTTNPDPDTDIEFGRYPQQPVVVAPPVQPGQPELPPVTGGDTPLIPPTPGLTTAQTNQANEERLRRRLLAELQASQNELYGGGLGSWDNV